MIVKDMDKISYSQKDWKTIDFHVHTPASHDFIPISEDVTNEYVSILRIAQESNINLLVISDHNTIDGYFKFQEIHDDLKKTQKVITLLKETDSDFENKVKQQLEYFEKVTILPGIELDTYPNVHILILLDPTLEREKIEEGLLHSGFPRDDRGKEISSEKEILPVESAMNYWGKMGCLVIASHVDSNKGLFEETKTWGEKRVSAFTNEFLFGMEFNNPKTRDKIRSIYQDPKYHRDSQIAFVQSTDYHGNSKHTIGQKKTYIKIGEITKDKSSLFRCIKEALRNPFECISAPESPEVAQILSNLLDSPGVEEFNSADNQSVLLKYLVAFANTVDGTFVIGKNNQNNWIGISSESREQLLNQLSEIISARISPPLNYECEIYDYGIEKYIVSIRIKKRLQVFTVSDQDDAYILENGVAVRANTRTISEIAERNVLQRYKSLSITHQISDVSRRLSGLADTIDVLPLIRKIDQKSIRLKKINPIAVSGDKIPEFAREQIDDFMNGTPNGNLVILRQEKPRYTDSYLRLSPPKIDCQIDGINDLISFSGPKIIISPGGAAFFDTSDGIKICCDKYKPLVISGFAEEFPSFTKICAAFLKTSISIWYSERCFGSYDIRNERILFNIPVPDMKRYSEANDLIRIIDELLGKEKNFLEEENLLENKLKTEDVSTDELITQLGTHSQHFNDVANILMKEIEDHFYSFFEFSIEEIQIVENKIKSMGLKSFS